MSEPHDHDHDDAHGHDHGHASGGDSDTHGHLPGPVRSALGLLADGLDKARNLAGPAGEKARFMTDKVREESADVFDKVRDEGTHVVNKLRGHSGASDTGSSTSSATGHGADDRQQRVAEALDIAKTVGAALLVGSVKVVQLAMREWQAHTGNASTPEDNVPRAAWDTAGTPKAPAQPATGDEAEPQPVPEINNWDDVEAETADDAWSDETDADEPTGDTGSADLGGTASGDPLAGVPLTDTSDDGHVEVTEALAYTSGSDGAGDATTISDITDSPADADTSGAALRTEVEPQHSGTGHGTAGHDAPGHSHTDPPLEGFDEMTIGSLRGRLGSLSADELAALRDYEREHSARPQVLTMLENRIAKVAAHGSDA